MLVKIKKTIVQEAEVDIEFPYYYEVDMMFDHTDMIYYGKVEQDKTTTITVDKHNNDLETRYEVLVEFHRPTKWSTPEYKYHESQYKSTVETFEKIKQEALEFLQKV